MTSLLKRHQMIAVRQNVRVSDAITAIALDLSCF